MNEIVKFATAKGGLGGILATNKDNALEVNVLKEFYRTPGPVKLYRTRSTNCRWISKAPFGIRTTPNHRTCAVKKKKCVGRRQSMDM